MFLLDLNFYKMLDSPNIVDSESTELALENPDDDYSRILDQAGF